MQQASISTTTNLQDYFLTELKQSVSSHGLKTGDGTLWYLSNLLYTYRRSEQFFDYRPEGGTLTPLAEYYRYASEAKSEIERRQFLQRLGDVSLFVASLFKGALNRKPIDVSYYLSMGEGAYATLHNAPVKNSRDSALHSIFGELADHFEELVIAVSGLSKQQDTEDSLMDKIEQWEATKDPLLEKELRSRGVILLDCPEQSH